MTSINKIIDVVANDAPASGRVVDIRSNGVIVATSTGKLDTYPLQTGLNVGDIVLVKDNRLLKVGAVNATREYNV